MTDAPSSAFRLQRLVIRFCSERCTRPQSAGPLFSNIADCPVSRDARQITETRRLTGAERYDSPGYAVTSESSRRPVGVKPKRLRRSMRALACGGFAPHISGCAELIVSCAGSVGGPP